jgi:PAS domain S-box-containing protein
MLDAQAGFASGDYMAHRVSSLSGAAVGPEQLFTLLDSVREILAIVSPDGTIQFTTQGFEQVLGFRTEDLTGKLFTSLVHPNDAASTRHTLREIALSAGGTASFRCRLQSKDGSWRWFDASAKDHTKNPVIEGIVLSCRDVTDLQRMEAERQVISEVVHALNETANLDELLAGIHKALKKVLYAENCFVALHNPETETFSFPFFADQVDVAPPPQKVGRSCTAFVFHTGSAMLIPQSEFDRLAAQGRVELVGSPSPAWLGVPLKTPKATIGVLVVQHYENENAYDLRDLEFLSSVGGHIALAIERRRAEVQANTLGHVEPLLERRVDLVRSRSVGDEAAQVAPGSVGRSREGSRHGSGGFQKLTPIGIGHIRSQRRAFPIAYSVRSVRMKI